MPSQESLDEFTLIRQSPILLLFRLLLIQFSLEVIYFLSLFPLERIYFVFRGPLQGTWETIWFVITIFTFVSFFQIVIIVLITLGWMNDCYIVRPGAIIHRQGIFHLLEETYSLKNVEAFTVQQNLFQKIFRYGHIQFYSPVLKQGALCKSG